MTIVIAFRCIGEEDGDGIIIASDKRATDGVTSIEVEKIVPICCGLREDGFYANYLAIASGAGHAAIVRQFIRIAEHIFIEKFTNEWDSQNPEFEEFEEAVLELQNEFIEKLDIWKKNGFQPSIEILICGLSPKGEASMYQFGPDGAALAVHKSPGFAGLGHGFATGGNLILRQFWNPEIDEDQGTNLCAYLIDMVSEIDPTVSRFDGSSYYFRLNNGKPIIGPISIEALDVTIEETEMRKDILDLTWQLCDHIGEKDFIKELERIRKKHGMELHPKE